MLLGFIEPPSQLGQFIIASDEQCRTQKTLARFCSLDRNLHSYRQAKITQNVICILISFFAAIAEQLADHITQRSFNLDPQFGRTGADGKIRIELSEGRSQENAVRLASSFG